MKNIFITIIAIFLITLSCKKDKYPDVGIHVTDYSVNTNSTLYAVSFFDNNFGVILGRFNDIYITEDGALTWQKKTYNVGSLIYFFSVEAISRQTILCGQDVIYKSNDTCNSWNLLDFPEVGPRIKDFYFFNENTGFYCTDKIYKTYNQGTDWQQVYPAGSGIQTGLNTIQEIIFNDDNSIGYAYGGFSYDGITNGIILKTVNKGNEWINLNANLPEITSMLFWNDMCGIISTFYRYIYKTTDGGISWEKQDELCPCIYPKMMLFKESGTILITCNEELYITTNKGESWIKCGEVPSDIAAVSRLTDNSYVAVGKNGGIYLIYKT